MAAIYSNGGNRWNILGFNFTKRDALSVVYIRYLWCVYNSTEIQGRNSLKENWDQLFVILEPPPLMYTPGNRTPNTSRFHSRLFPARVKESLHVSINIKYQYIFVM
jgi:hypothetical protein